MQSLIGFTYSHHISKNAASQALNQDSQHTNLLCIPKLSCPEAEAIFFLID